MFSQQFWSLPKKPIDEKYNDAEGKAAWTVDEACQDHVVY